MSQDCDVVVIGAGIAGASAAASIARLRDVVILERESAPGYHATGRSAAYYAPAYGNSVIRQVTALGESFYRTPPEGFSDADLLRPRASLFVGDESKRQSLQTLASNAPHTRLVDAAECVDLVPVLKSGVIAGGVLDEQGGDLDVDAILQGFLREFRGAGGTLQTGAEVISMNYVDDRWHIETSEAEYRAPVVVNAAGAWADSIAVLAGGAALGITPMQRTALLVDAPAKEIDDWPLVVEVNESFYFKPDAGQLLLSPADETPRAAYDAQPEELDIATAIDRVQQVADIEVRKVNHSWAGLRSFAPDKSIVCGFDQHMPGFCWLAGQGGYGVQTAPAMSAIAGYVVTGQSDRLDIAAHQELLAALSPTRLQ